MRALPLALLALAASPAFADPINITDKDGSPAIEASGSSSTTISVVGGAASVTVKGSGKLGVYTHSGTVSGQGALGVPELGVELGGALGNAPGSETPADGVADPSGQPVDGAIVAEGQADIAALAEGQCAMLPPDSIVADEIGLILDESAVSVIAACAGQAQIDAARLEAIGANSVLTGALSARGYGPQDVLAIDTMADGQAALFVAAAD